MPSAAPDPGPRIAAASTDRQLEGILALQRRNLRQALTPLAQNTDGFVFAEHTLPILQEMAARLPQVVALDGDEVVGYNLALHPDLRGALPRLAPMFDQFDRTVFRGVPLPSYRYAIGGQVCVDHGWRGRNLMRRLYEGTREHLAPEYQLIVTEVAPRNQVSLRAHLRMGFETAGSYHDGEEAWHVVAWPLNGKAGTSG